MRAFLITIFFLFLLGCSPGAFYGDGIDKQLQNDKGYRKINKSCSDLDLSNSWIDGPTFKKMINCFNANGAMPDTAALINYLSEDELEPLVKVFNRYVLSDKWLYKLERSYQRLESTGTLSETLEQFGRIIENEEFVGSGIALLKKGYFAQNGKLKEGILQALELIGRKLNEYESSGNLHSRVSEALDVALSVADAKAFQSLQTSFSDEVDGRYDLHTITSSLLAFLKLPTDPNRVGLEEIIDVFSKGAFDPVIDALIPLKEETFATEEGQTIFKQSIVRISSVLRTTLNSDALILNKMTELFSVLSSHEVRCLNGTQQLKNVHQTILEEISKISPRDASTFIQRENYLNLIAAAPLCDFPSEVYSGMPVLLDFANSRAFEPAADIIKAFFVAPPPVGSPLKRTVKDLFVNVLSDHESVRLLLPALVEFNRRETLDDIILLSTVLKLERREDLKNGLKFLIEKRPELKNRSIYEVMLEALSNTSVGHINEFVRSFDFFIHQREPILSKALRSIRSAYHSNSVHPGVEILIQFLTDARENQKLFDTIFTIADSAKFKNAIKEISEMARTRDGRLKDLLGAVVGLFHEFAQKGAIEVKDLNEPRFEAEKNRWHNFSKNDLPEFPLVPENPELLKPCRELDLSVPIDEAVLKESRDDTDSQDIYRKQLDNLEACLNYNGKHSDLVEAIRFLRRERIDKDRTFLSLPIGWISAIKLPDNQLKYLTEQSLTAINNGKAGRLLHLLPFLATTEIKVETAPGIIEAGSVLEPLVALADPIMKNSESRQALSRLSRYGAEIIRRDDIQPVAAFIDKSWNTKVELPEFELNNQYDLERIARWIENKECAYLPADPFERELAKKQRVRQITEEYEEAITNTSIQTGTENGLPIFSRRREWNKKELIGTLKPLLDGVAYVDPKNSKKGMAALKGLLRFMQFFTLPSPDSSIDKTRHYHFSELRKFLEIRSNDYRLMSFAYAADDTSPAQRRVRLVNGLDKLETLMLAGDINLEMPPTSINVARRFLTMIAEAWGDEEFENRPIEIQQKFPKGKKQPLTLAEAVAEIRELVSSLTKPMPELELPAAVTFPVLPFCNQTANPSDPPDLQQQELYEPGADIPTDPNTPINNDPMTPVLQAAIYNVHVAIPFLEENLPGAVGPYASGMKILRDLVFSLYYSLYRSPRAELPDTNLSVALESVKLGLLRTVAQLVARVPEGELYDSSVNDLIKSLADGAASPEIEPLANRLLRQDSEHTLILTFVDNAFDAFDNEEDKQRIKRLGLFGLASASQVAGRDDILSLLNPALRTVSAVLSPEDYYSFLIRNAGSIIDLLKTENLSNFTASFYSLRDDQAAQAKSNIGEILKNLLNDSSHATDLMALLSAIDQTPEHRKARFLFLERLKQLDSLKEYNKFELKKIIRELLDFFEGKSEGVISKELSRNLLNIFAQRLEAGDVEIILDLAARDPKQFYSIFTSLSYYVESGSIDEFFRLIANYFKNNQLLRDAS